MSQEVIDIKTIFGSSPKMRLDVAPTDLLANMEQWGISRAITTASSAILYDDVSGNAETWRECEGQPWLIPAATLHPYNYLASERKIAAFREKGFPIFRFFNKIQGFSLDLYCVTALLRDLSEIGMPCIMDATALDDPRKIARLSAENEVDVICTGLGYTFEAEVIALAQDYPRLYFDAGRLTGPDGIELFCEHVGAHRLVYGSDFPFDDTLPSLLMLQQAEISEDERQQIASYTIKELMGI